MYESFQAAKHELTKIRTVSNRRFRNILGINLKEALLLQRNIIGAYVRRSMIKSNQIIRKSFKDMSYIKLEVIAQRKKELYTNISDGERSRGDVKYLDRNEKQYFWTFNGEFWADELGDYVFALRSECHQ